MLFGKLMEIAMEAPQPRLRKQAQRAASEIAPSKKWSISLSLAGNTVKQGDRPHFGK
jgi:hypothetical protein